MRLEDLKKIRESMQGDMHLREGEARFRIIVGMGTCGIAAGAREVLSALVAELAETGIDDVIVTQAGCKGMCEKEPIVDVMEPGKPTVTYGYIDAGKAREIIREHISGGRILDKYVVVVGQS